MATYIEIAEIKDGDNWNSLLQKIKVAVVIKAAAIIDSTTPGATALSWAESTISNPHGAGESIANYVLAANSGATVAQIYSATDTAIQTNVDAAVDAIYGV